MRFIVALAALVATASALPSAPRLVSNHALETRQDFAEDDFEIPAEPDTKKRQVDWPEVSSLQEEQDLVLSSSSSFFRNLGCISRIVVGRLIRPS